MQIWRNQSASTRAIIVLLSITVFFLTLLQAHLHFHTTDTHEAHHAHSVDIHIFNDVVEQDHHDNVTVLEAKSTGILKKQLDEDILPILAFALFSLLVICLLRLIGYVAPVKSAQHLRSRHRYFTPLLRAPPQH